MSRRLTLGRNLGRGLDRDLTKRAINEVTHVAPTDADVARVRARLAAGGWPLAKVEPSAAERAAGAS